MRRLHPALLLLAAAACDTGASTPAGGSAAPGAPGGRVTAEALPDSAFAIDLSTPDRALRSHWKIQQLQMNLSLPLDSTSAYSRAWKRLEQAEERIKAGSALEAHRLEQADTVRPRYAREILDVQQQTDSRAVVTARIKNVTPIPAGATPSGYDVERRSDGEVVRYVFEKVGGDWRLVQIHTQLIEGEWREYYDPQPRVPTWTYP